MLSTQDFAHEVWLSLENIRERLAVLETEARHTRCHLQRLEGRGRSPYVRAGAEPEESRADGAVRAEDNGASIHIRISRKTLGSIGGGGAIGGGLLAGVMGLGRALGWW